MFLRRVFMIKCQKMSHHVRRRNFCEGSKFSTLALNGLNFYIVTCYPVTFTCRCNLTRVWKLAKRLVASQIHSGLGCGGETALHLTWDLSPFGRKPGAVSTTTAIVAATATTTTLTMSQSV
jgi:hypothetical protein